MAEVKDLSNIALRRHPEYADRVEHWEFLESCYEGGRDWFADNIFRYLKEGQTEYDDRVERAYRFNHSREVVDLLNKYMFRTEISRNETDAPDYIQKFWKEATPKGDDVDHLMGQIAKRSSISGRIYIVIDNNGVDQPIYKRDEKQNGFRTYAYWVGPQDVLDMSFDEEGNLNWILIREKYREDSDPWGTSLDADEQFRLWTRDEWFLYRYERDEEGKILTGDLNKPRVEQFDSGAHGLGMVPVVIVDHMEDDSDYSAPALINDIAYLDRAVANYLSNLDAIIQDQTFSQLAMPAQALMPGEEESLKRKLTELGTKRIFVFNGESGAAPSFLSPDPRQATLIITAIKQIINEIYHTVGMAGERTKMDNSMGIDNSSGVAKAYDFDRVNALLINKSKSLQKAEIQIMKIVSAWNGDLELDAEGLIKWSETFDVRGLADEFEVASQLALVQAPETMRKEQMRGLRDKLFPTLENKKRDAMESEITSDWPPEPEMFELGDGGENGASEDEEDDSSDAVESE